MLMTVVNQGGVNIISIRRNLQKMVGEEDTNILLTGLSTNSDPLAILGLLLDLTQLSQGEIDWTTFARQLYPVLIRGRFDPFQWAADPDRHSDMFNVQCIDEPVDDAIIGFPGAFGIVEEQVRVIATVEESDQLQVGEILVTTVTNIEWTPLFPQVAAVVTYVGAPLSHAAIVARELGIPAVVGCGDTTMRLKTGDRVRVDGGKGIVKIIFPS